MSIETRSRAESPDSAGCSSALSGAKPAESILTRLMRKLDPRADKAHDRDDESTVIDRRPPLEQLPVYTGEGTVSSWVLAEEGSDDAWMSAVNTIPEGEWR